MRPSNRTFSIQADAKGKQIDVKISETPGVSAENLSLATWGSSYILANQLHHWREAALYAVETCSSKKARDHEIIPVLELGAGTSLVGISAAALWALNAIVTDLPGIVPGLAQNISVNETLLKEAGVKVQCGTLDWSKPSTLSLHDQHSSIEASTSKASTILAADTVYAEDHPELLANTITTWLAPDAAARVILCYVLRHTYIDIIRDLWERLEEAGLECVEEGKADADPDTWDDVAPFEWCVWRWRQASTAAIDGHGRK